MNAAPLARSAGRVLLGLLWLISSCTAPAGDVSGLQVNEVLRRVREATGWSVMATRREGWRLHGSCLDQGLEGTYVDLFRPDGRFVSRVGTELPVEVIHDGETVWTVDHTGMPRVSSLGSRWYAIGSAWVARGRWLDPEQSIFDVTLSPEHSTARGIAVELRLLEGGFRATLLVDRSSWLPATILLHLPAGERRVELSDYRAPMGFQLPHLTCVTTAGGERSIFRVQGVEPMPAFLRNPFQAPVGRPADAHFREGAPAELEQVRRARTGHLLVRPRVEGRDVGWFLLDSGAGMNCIDSRTADELGLARFGDVEVVGVGGTNRTGYRRGSLLELGPLSITGLPWLELDLVPLSKGLGEQLAGILGYDLFARAVVEFDIAREQAWIHDPERWSRPAACSTLRLDGALPAVRTSFEASSVESSGWFKLDTGSDDTVTFHGPAVRDLHLIRGHSDLQPIRIEGIGGTSYGLRGPLASFELDGVRFERLQATYIRDASGVLDDTATLGHVGAGLLGLQRVVIDLPHLELSIRESR